MVRLSELSESNRKHIEGLDCPEMSDSTAGQPFVKPIDRDQRKVALISSAGLVQRGDSPFRGGDSGYRGFSGAIDNSDILVSHVSVNFDRTAACRNIEAIFPRDTLKTMADSGEVGEASDTHYSFMGATDPLEMEESANELAAKLIDSGVNSLVLLPV